LGLAYRAILLGDTVLLHHLLSLVGRADRCSLSGRQWGVLGVDGLNKNRTDRDQASGNAEHHQWPHFSDFLMLILDLGMLGAIHY